MKIKPQTTPFQKIFARFKNGAKKVGQKSNGKRDGQKDSLSILKSFRISESHFETRRTGWSWRVERNFGQMGG